VNVTLGVVSDVPNLVGEPPAGARQKVEKAALEVGTFTGRLKHKPEIVVGQVPAAGSQVIAGHKIGLMLGSKVPRLSGLKFTAAGKKLHGVGLRMQKMRPPWANAVVIWQSPKHGRPLRARGVVHVHFGARVPNLFARTIVDARKALGHEGLHLGRISPSIVPPGRAFVVTQGIRRKRLVRLGTKIKVAMGTTVPDLSDLTLDQAKHDLTKLHFSLGAVAKMVQPGYSGPPVIAAQSTSAGKLARFNAKIGVKTLVAPPPKKTKAAASKKHKGKTTNRAHAKAARSEHRNSPGTRGAGQAPGSNG
jgi:beta-lactam-binding protein with PASTA domain